MSHLDPSLDRLASLAMTSDDRFASLAMTRDSRFAFGSR
jgi:hypothetical protein